MLTHSFLGILQAPFEELKRLSFDITLHSPREKESILLDQHFWDMSHHGVLWPESGTEGLDVIFRLWRHGSGMIFAVGQLKTTRGGNSCGLNDIKKSQQGCVKALNKLFSTPELFMWMALKTNKPHDETRVEVSNFEDFHGATLILSEERLMSLFAGLDSLDFLPHSKQDITDDNVVSARSV